MEAPDPPDDAPPALTRDHQRHLDEACWGLRNASQWLLAYVPGPSGPRPESGDEAAQAAAPEPRTVVLGHLARNSLDALAGPLLRALVDEAVDARLAELDAEAEED